MNKLKTLGLGLLATALSYTSMAQDSSKVSRNLSDYKTLAHAKIAMESEANILPELRDSAYFLLENILDSSRAISANSEDDYLKSIAKTLDEYRPRVKKKCSSLIEGLVNRHLDCDMLSIMYLSIDKFLEKNSLSMACAPSHVFIVGNKENTFWETTTPLKTSKEFYEGHFSFKEEKATKDVYLSKLDSNGLVSVVLNGVGSYLRSNKKYDAAEEYFDESLKYDSLNINSLIQKIALELSKSDVDVGSLKKGRNNVEKLDSLEGSLGKLDHYIEILSNNSK